MNFERENWPTVEMMTNRPTTEKKSRHPIVRFIVLNSLMEFNPESDKFGLGV
jgi:hypothetical protein